MAIPDPPGLGPAVWEVSRQPGFVPTCASGLSPPPPLPPGGLGDPQSLISSHVLPEEPFLPSLSLPSPVQCLCTPQSPTWRPGPGSAQVSFPGGSLRAGVINQQSGPRTAPCSVPSLSWPCPLGLREMSTNFRYCAGNQ